MNTIQTITLQELEDSVNVIFECQQKQATLELQKYSIDTELMLMQNMIRALQLIDRGTD